MLFNLLFPVSLREKQTILLLKLNNHKRNYSLDFKICYFIFKYVRFWNSGEITLIICYENVISWHPSDVAMLTNIIVKTDLEILYWTIKRIQCSSLFMWVFTIDDLRHAIYEVRDSSYIIWNFWYDILALKYNA